MATIVKIDSRSKAAKFFLEYIRTLSFVQIEEPTRFNPSTEKAISNAKKGIGVIKTTSHSDLMNKLSE